MRIGIVSETYPPEINGVSLTVHSLAAGLATQQEVALGQGHGDRAAVLVLSDRDGLPQR